MVVGGIVAAVALLGGGRRADRRRPPRPRPRRPAAASAAPAPSPSRTTRRPAPATTSPTPRAARQGRGHAAGEGRAQARHKTMTLETNLGDIVVELATPRRPARSTPSATWRTRSTTTAPSVTGWAPTSSRCCSAATPLAKADGKSPADGQGGPGYVLVEREPQGRHIHARGVAMARQRRPASTGSQFFIVYGDIAATPELHTVRYGHQGTRHPRQGKQGGRHRRSGRRHRSAEGNRRNQRRDNVAARADVIQTRDDVVPKG